MNGSTISCDTITLTNKAKIYWQYNCDNIWLTLENVRKEKFIINEVSVNLFNLTYRLGYHLIKEYKNSLLFRSGCPANGPCIYTLIDKSNGAKVKEFNQLICIDTDIKWRNPHKYNFDFVVYLSDTTNHLIIYYVDNSQLIKIPFEEKLTKIIPQNQFNEMTLENNILTIHYTLENNIKKSLIIDLNDQNHIY